ncbi:MAG: hypothetical protein Kow009_07780 [Spirochaetales bacterium]
MERRETILDTAFQVWGKLNFTQTSLTPIAKHLGITKAALYKHFHSKDDLLQAMELRFLSRYRAFHEEFFQEVEGLDLSGAVLLFMEKVVRFYLENPYFLPYFYFLLLRRRLAEREDIVPLFLRQREVFRKLFLESGIENSEEDLEARLHFLYIATTFWVSTLFLNLSNCKRPAHKWQHPESIDEETWKGSLARWHRYCMQGLFTPRQGDTIDHERRNSGISYREIEGKITLPMPPRREHDRIFQAIVDVSFEVGFREATVERIAEKLGMSKSSLYSHFRNKRSMFETLIREERRFMLKVLKEAFASLEGFAEQSYGFMYVTLQHTLSNPSLLSLFNWFRFQNIRIPIRPPRRALADEMNEYFGFFFEARARGELACSDEELIPSAILLHVLTFRTLQGMEPTPKLDQTMSRIRAMHQLYLHGLSIPTLCKE